MIPPDIWFAEPPRFSHDRRMKTPAIFFCILATLYARPIDGFAQLSHGLDVKHKADSQTVDVTIGGKLFTTLHYNTYVKPILYPVIGPNGEEMTRSYPMKKGVAGEADDHHHHKSLWFTHGNINGIDFWSESKDPNAPAPKVKVEILKALVARNGEALIETAGDWLDKEGSLVFQDKTALKFGVENDDRFIDYQIEIIASEKDVVFGDTKEGTMAIRTHPALRLRGEVATGKAINDNWVTGREIWGKKAKWVDYAGTINNTTVGVAIFDHPSNLRHPTTWHARDYGLIGANPFGLHHFQGKPKGEGNHTVKKGDRMTLRYRFLFHKGDVYTAKIAERYNKWAK